MSVPRPLLAMIELLQDVTQKQDVIGDGPLRIEADLTALLGDPMPAALAAMLGRAFFLTPLCDEVPDEDGLAAIGALAIREQTWLDLRLPGLSELVGLPEQAALLTARVEMRTQDPRALVTADELVFASWGASLVAGRTTFRVKTDADGVAAVPELLHRMATFSVPVDLALVAQDADATSALETSWDELEVVARATSMNLRVAGGRRCDAGDALDPMSGFNVIDSVARSIFRTRGSLCPFPFTMARWDSKAAIVRPCPAPDGPTTRVADADPWNGTFFTTLRREFYENRPPAACRRCTLLPRILRAVEETPWASLPFGRSDLPSGSVEV